MVGETVDATITLVREWGVYLETDAKIRILVLAPDASSKRESILVQFAVGQRCRVTLLREPLQGPNIPKVGCDYVGSFTTKQ